MAVALYRKRSAWFDGVERVEKAEADPIPHFDLADVAGQPKADRRWASYEEVFPRLVSGPTTLNDQPNADQDEGANVAVSRPDRDEFTWGPGGVEKRMSTTGGVEWAKKADEKFESGTCKTCGKEISRHTEPGWSPGWFHNNSHVQDMHTAVKKGSLGSSYRRGAEIAQNPTKLIVNAEDAPEDKGLASHKASCPIWNGKPCSCGVEATRKAADPSRRTKDSTSFYRQEAPWCHGCGDELVEGQVYWHGGERYCGGCESAPSEGFAPLKGTHEFESKDNLSKANYANAEKDIMDPSGWQKCKQCGDRMNPVEAMLSSESGVCGKCVDEGVKRLVGKAMAPTLGSLPTLKDVHAGVKMLDATGDWLGKSTLTLGTPAPVLAKRTVSFTGFTKADDDHAHKWGPVEYARMTGNPNRPCTVSGCRTRSLDLDDEDDEGDDGDSVEKASPTVPGHVGVMSTDRGHQPEPSKRDERALSQFVNSPKLKQPRGFEKAGDADFKAWFARVDGIISAKAGVGAEDLADQTWRDWFDSGKSASAAANAALRNEGFPG